MADEKQVLDLDIKDFKLSDYDNIRIDMPEKTKLSEEDIDAQLFDYVLSSGKNIQSIADLDDEWVKSNFDGLETIDDVRQAIRDQYDKEMEYSYNDIKFRNCCDALIDRLEGDVPQEIIDSNADALRSSNAARLEAMHISMEQFLREEHMSQDQYDEKLKDEALYQLRLNAALDLMADVLGMQVGNHEITEYLSAPNPEAFLEEIREKGQVENARKAAKRVKVMRRVIDTALVNGASEPEKVLERKAREEQNSDETKVPAAKDMPVAQIRDDIGGDEWGWGPLESKTL